MFYASHLLIAAPQPVSPLGKDGKPLNFDFETGTLKDWLAEGNAFEKQPVRGDLVAKRSGPGGTSNHQGDFWIGGWEVMNDDGMGTLASVPFKVTHPFASFLIAGGDWPATRVELIDQATQRSFFKATGEQSEHLRPVVVDLQKFVGKEIFIRLVDQQKGHWGHLNFDNFRFYSERPKFSNEVDSKKQGEALDVDQVAFEGLSGEEAAAKMSVPPGFKATLFAGEPDVQQPIGFCLDDRGRLWVAEAYTYPIRAEEGKGRDRIIVLEDTDGDGKFNRRTVFMEGLNLVSGIAYGFGGVWVGAPPQLLFIPIEDGDAPKPAGKPEVVLDGWAWQDTHETLNTFMWGPDGWLYGCHGVFTHSNVGKPGAPDSERTRINAGIWRYHPTKKTFEVFGEGTSNPWGIDFDSNGQLFAEACVIPHLFHIVQGGRFHRQAGSHFNPFTYEDIKNCADHVHWAGNKGPHAANSRSDAAGGGHAHAGLMIYQGDNWPKEFRGNIFIGNIHGQRINMDIPDRKGSGFLVRHAPDPINFNDKWSQVLNFISGPDGGVYFIDWYDKNQCHHNNVDGHDRSNGRIFKVSYGTPNSLNVDLQRLSDKELVNLLASNNGWHARHARRILQERTHQKSTASREIAQLIQKGSKIRTIEQLWATHVTGNPVDVFLRDRDEYVRAWTIQLLCEGKQVSKKNLAQFVAMAREEKSPVVRLYLASAMLRLPLAERWDVIEGLCGHSEDAGDHNLPALIWYGLEPLPTLDAARALRLAQVAKLPSILNFTIRRTAAIGTPEAMAAIMDTLQRVTDDQAQLQIVEGLAVAFKGQRNVAMPSGWEAAEQKLTESPNAAVRAQTMALSLTFGSKNALASMRKTLMNPNADPFERRTALDSLLSTKDNTLASLLHQLLGDASLRGPVIRGLAGYDDPHSAEKILAVYPSLSPVEKRDALNTLVSRASFAKSLLLAVGKDVALKKDLSADLIRQLRNLKNEELNKDIETVWGAVREASADKKPLMEKYKKVFWAGGSQPGDARRGRAVYDKTCGQCHTLFDAGGKVGPDLTGSNRGDLDYILENMVDPNAVIPNDYRASTLETKDDRVITGIVKSQDDKSVTIVTPNETLTIPRNEIAALKQNELSMMPEGLLDPLNEQEIRDLIYYLRQPGQVPLPSGGQ